MFKAFGRQAVVAGIIFQLCKVILIWPFFSSFVIHAILFTKVTEMENLELFTKTCYNQIQCPLETVQGFLIKLGIKPRMRVLEISIFSLNHVIVRPTNSVKDTRKEMPSV